MEKTNKQTNREDGKEKRKRSATGISNDQIIHA